MVMKCPKCSSGMKRVSVNVEGAKSKALSFQCPECGFTEFEKNSAAAVLKELKAGESPLRIRQKIVKLSSNRLGFYFNKNIVRSLELRSGEEVFVSVPDKKHIILNLE